MHAVYPPVEVGQVYGEYTVLERAENRFRQKRWLCRCTCGNERVVWQTSLNQGNSLSCGCKSRLGDLTGQRFGRLTVIRLYDTVEYQKRWFCRCDCGGETISWQQALRAGHSKSCGCLKSEKECKKWSDFREPNFWKKINKNAPGGCWEWTGTMRGGNFPSPYPQVGYQGKVYRAHRLSWMLVNGPIPDGKLLLHSCDNPKCCNPSHLRIGTHRENMQDVVSRGRRKGKLSGENNGRSLLSQAQADEIRALYATDTISQQALADRYGVSQFAISAIVRNKRYVTDNLPVVQQPLPVPKNIRSRKSAGNSDQLSLL